MENKLTIINGEFGHVRVVSNDYIVASFHELKYAQEYVAWKNQNVISKEAKELAIDCLISIKKYGIRPEDFNNKFLDEAIEIIKSLRDSE